MSQYRRLSSAQGFTLIELLIVITIISILATLAVPSYKRSTIKARETVLLEDLHQIRVAIDAYYADQRRYPDSLEALVENKYLRDLPRDPMTEKDDTWEEISPEPAPDGTFAEGGVFDVRSGSDLVGLNGIPYREW